jgi:tetratricopeptide (TPR) repeat protein
VDDRLDALVRRGREHRVAGDLEGAVAVFTHAHDRFPAAARPLCERGAVLLLEHRFAEALVDYRAAEALDPAYPGLWSYFAEVHLYLGAPDEALAAAGRGLRAEPDDLMHRINLAHALLFLGRRAAAEAEYRDLRDERHPTKGVTGGEIVREDLRLLRAAGVTAPGMDAVDALAAAP